MPSQSPAPKLRLASGVGLVAANMIGSGVFLSAGFMAQSMGPGPILVAWVVGALMALCGAAAYGAVARLVPRSGGEYRYLSDLLHPAAGFLAGWASLLVGFSAPIAVDALAASAFAGTFVPGLPHRATAAGFVVLLTGLHATGYKASFRFQNVLILLKVLLLAGFVVAGLVLGAHAWPADWTQPAAGGAFPWDALWFNLLFITFAYSGWNAAVYAAEEFEAPERTVPRAMMLGAVLVGLLYLAVNWIFVANLTPADATVVFGYGRFAAGGGGESGGAVTLGHAVMARLAGPAAAGLWSAATVVVFLSAMSAMTFLGPRVYAAMARDGFLPAFLAGGEHPPRSAVLLQGALALLIVLTQRLQAALALVGGVLMLFAALTAVGLVVARLRGRTPTPPKRSVAAAVAYVGLSGWLFWAAVTNPALDGTTGQRLLGIVAVLAVGLLAYALSRRAPARAA